MSSTQVVVTIVVIVLVILVIAGLWAWNRSRRLKQQFGPEYDRAVKDNDGRLAGERELRERERRHSQLQLKDLDPEARARYAASWEDVQVLFVEDPISAVRQGDALVTQLIADRGYPQGSYDDQVAQLSVEHAQTLQHYRDAHEISEVNERGEATTEQLRQALVHYRSLFADVLGEDTVGRPSTDRVATDVASTDLDTTPDAALDTAPDADRPDATTMVDPDAVNAAVAGRHAADADPRTTDALTPEQRAAVAEQEDSRA